MRMGFRRCAAPMLMLLSRIALDDGIPLQLFPASVRSGLQGFFMSFIIYLVGFAIFIGGVAWAMITAGVPHLYVAIASVILLGIGILTGVARTRGKDPA